MRETFRLLVTEVLWPAVGGGVVLIGTVEHGFLRGDGELVLLDGDGGEKARLQRAFVAASTPASRPGQLARWLGRGGLPVVVPGLGRGIASPGDALVRRV